MSLLEGNSLPTQIGGTLKPFGQRRSGSSSRQRLSSLCIPWRLFGGLRISTLVRALVLGSLASVVLQVGAVEAAPSSWSITPSPNVGTDGDFLDAVSCIGTAFCESVGWYVGSPDEALILSWNGTAWSVVPSPNPGGSGAILDDVACTSTSNCEAVGYYTPPGSEVQTLVESWNGTAWSVVPSPNPGIDDSLSSVSCSSDTSCVAVGSEYLDSPPARFETVIESWNGTAWSIDSSPNLSSHNNSLNGVSCASATMCVAVGSDGTNTVTSALIESWNGTTWSTKSGGSEGDDTNLNSVSCPTTKFCLAVGSGYGSLVESFNGRHWSIGSSGNKGKYSNILNGVACISSNDCAAVGQYRNGRYANNKVLIEAWNGTRSVITASPKLTTGFLDGIACSEKKFCEAVGQSGGSETLIETFS
jgi:hypothetical protein